MIILATDPANSTGYALARISDDGKTADIYEYGFIDIEDKTYAGDQYIAMQSAINDLIIKHKVDEITVEDYFFSKKFATGVNLNAAYRAIIHLTARQNSLPYYILNISSWKLFINGRTTPTKEQKIKWGKEASKKLMTQESLWKTWGIRFPNHSISCLTGEPIKPRSDIVDAVGMLIFFLKIYKRVDTITCSVPVPKDVEWKRSLKNLFTYDK